MREQMPADCAAVLSWVGSQRFAQVAQQPAQELWPSLTGCLCSILEQPQSLYNSQSRLRMHHNLNSREIPLCRQPGDWLRQSEQQQK